MGSHGDSSVELGRGVVGGISTYRKRFEHHLAALGKPLKVLRQEGV